ncbi:MAG: SigE family RNA polymerase sigma factor [Frankiaceae bacterium]|nr:SigE family RNA polymerase sigma factor [Frankiaceae bacterium]
MPATHDEDFASFVSMRSGPLLRLAVGLAGSRPAGEDLLQSALTRAYLSWSKVRGAADVDAYVRRIVVNSHVSVLRRRRVREELQSDVADVVGTAPSYGIDDRDALWTALARLGRRQRAIVLLRYYEDMADEQIAELLGCRPATVRSQAMRALATLKDLPELAEHKPRPAAANVTWEIP